MFKIDNCGIKSLEGLSNLSMTGPTGINGPDGIKSYIQNYIISNKPPYVNINSNPIPVEVEVETEQPEELNMMMMRMTTTMTQDFEDLQDPNDDKPYIITSIQNNIKGIKKRESTPMTFKPPYYEDIEAGQNQPAQGVDQYTLGPLNLKQYDASNYPNNTFFEILLPFKVEYDFKLYDKIYIHGNSYVTFGDKYILDNIVDWNIGVNGFNPPIPTIFIGTGVAYPKNYYHGYENDNTTFRIRYEGDREGYDEKPFIWEIVFYKNNPSRIDISAENIDFSGFTGLSNGNGFLANFFLVSNSGVICQPQNLSYKNINITSNNISTEQIANDYNIEMNPLNPIKSYTTVTPILFFLFQNDVLEFPGSVIFQSPYDINLNSGLPMNFTITNGDISFIPTFQSTEGPGGYVTIINPAITQTGTSNILIENGYCKLI